MHAGEEGQDTSLSLLPLAPDGFGVGWTTHFVPFQCSARVTWALTLPDCPTAMQSVADRHDTPVRPDSFPPGCFGVGWIAHFGPFQCSARVSDLESVRSFSPTAVQEVADEQDTPASTLPSLPVTGFGVAWIVHFVPFQCSARVFLLWSGP